MLSRIALGVSAFLAAPLAWAQASQCATCAECTAALARPNAEVQLTTDLALHGADPCIVVRGEGSHFNGQGHVVLAQPAGGTGVRVEAADAGVRNLRVTGADIGVHIARAHDVVLYNVTVEARATGVKVESAPGARLERVHVVGGRVGVSFGAADDGTCPMALAMRSPGAVIVRSVVERAGTGIAACDARPVLTGNAVTRNQVGVILGEPGAGLGNGGFVPYDACVCAPELAAMHPGTVTVFSSGCGSCQVHEGWMPSLRRRGADILVRESGPHTEDAQARFDHFAWRCMPGVMDSLGIPGCVPNYGCVSSGEFSKRRDRGDTLAVDVAINGEEDALHFTQRCAGSAQGRYARGQRCVMQGVTDNTFCDNRSMDVRLVGEVARWGGARNRCARVERWTEGAAPGCSQSCAGAPEPLPMAELTPPAVPPVAHEAPAVPVVAPRTPPPVVTPAARPGATPPNAPSGDEPLYIVAVLVAAVMGGAWFFRKRA